MIGKPTLFRAKHALAALAFAAVVAAAGLRADAAALADGKVLDGAAHGRDVANDFVPGDQRVVGHSLRAVRIRAWSALGEHASQKKAGQQCSHARGEARSGHAADPTKRIDACLSSS